MLEDLPSDRFSIKGLKRNPDDHCKYWGNFVQDVASFDHKFFNKSSREAASMDPQQRLLLQVAYEAIEASGAFLGLFCQNNEDTGCFIGACASDYNDNVASHPPNAFSSTGTLRAFLSGKVSHFFGFEGPSITYDTACSSSAVAIDAACKAIRLGDCSKALAGGVSVYSSPYFYQNLAAASFLSKTGATKSFDASADGYCRGEGAGLVVLKKLSAALADGDNILGIITGSGVNQNRNDAPITVPNHRSQVMLYQKVCASADISPLDVSYVETHGTGTPVGDPIEWNSIRKVFGGSQRRQVLHIASVKGNIGHLEGASGVAALIKVLLMIQHEAIPPQANFKTLNPKITSPTLDRMVIPRCPQPWEQGPKIAFINNYGAAGSNACLVVTDYHEENTLSHEPLSTRSFSLRYPVFISAKSPDALLRYSKALRNYMLQQALKDDELPSLAYNLAVHQNRFFGYSLAMTVEDVADLTEQLAVAGNESVKSRAQISYNDKPIVLVFGGQGGDFGGLDDNIYYGSTLFRNHLDHCNTAMLNAGLNSLFPHVFANGTVTDIVTYHCLLFSLQYSCAMSWIDSGTQVKALIGHSFGQLTALCVAGSISLEEAIAFISGRAALIRDCWGPEKGCMLSVEADTETISNLISVTTSSNASTKVEIACCNGSTSHVLVGIEQSIQSIEEAADRTRASGPVKHRKLNVTHGFHSFLVDPILPGLKRLAEELDIKQPKVPIETCSDGQNWSQVTAEKIVEHTRQPVYFEQAVQRLVDRLGSCLWIEAGSGSPIISMTRRILSKSEHSEHVFQSMQLDNIQAPNNIAEATVNLWKAGCRVQFWPFHRCQKSRYKVMNLPPYQFHKSKHWLPFVGPTADCSPSPESKPTTIEPEMLSFAGYEDHAQLVAGYRVDPKNQDYKRYVEGHAVVGNPLCPVPLYTELVAQAVMYEMNRHELANPVVQFQDIGITAPLGLTRNRVVHLTLSRLSPDAYSWTFKFKTAPETTSKKEIQDFRLHCEGIVSIENIEGARDLARYEKLTEGRFSSLNNDPESHAMQGYPIYESFARVVHYAEYYKGVKSIHAKGDEVAARVLLPSDAMGNFKKSITQPLAMDNFVQVAGIHVNSLRVCARNEVFVCTAIESIRPSFGYYSAESVRAWSVLSQCSSSGEKEVMNDIFVFNHQSNHLVLLIFGARFTRVSTASLSRALSHMNADTSGNNIAAVASASSKASVNYSDDLVTHARPNYKSDNSVDDISGRMLKDQHSENAFDVDRSLLELLSWVTDVSIKDVNDSTLLQDIGIDSLMSSEVRAEICKTYKIDVSPETFSGLLDVQSLWDHLAVELGVKHSVPHPIARPILASDASRPPTKLTTPSSSNEATEVGSRLLKLVMNHLETETALSLHDKLYEHGLDSLLTMELLSDIQKAFGISIEADQLSENTTMNDLIRLISPQSHQVDHVTLQSTSRSYMPVPNDTTPNALSTVLPQQPIFASHTQQAFERKRLEFSYFAMQSGAANFWECVYPEQARVVTAYVVEAFAALGCPLPSLQSGELVPPVNIHPRHERLRSQLYSILEDADLVVSRGNVFIRTAKQIVVPASYQMSKAIIESIPAYAAEHRLLHATGSRLAPCLAGAIDPLHILFRDPANKALLEEVYYRGPMYVAGSRLLGSFLTEAFSTPCDKEPFQILEIGGGTGGTSIRILDELIEHSVSFTYTFTDISPSLINAAKKTLRAYGDRMRFCSLDIEKEPPSEFLGCFHAIISSNCIHATRNLSHSMKTIRCMLREDGFVSLIEFTRNIFWFDLVFGLLDGWWLFNDGRKHVLADEIFWQDSMKTAGFTHVSWSGGDTMEARTLRIITGFRKDGRAVTSAPFLRPTKVENLVETVVYKTVGKTQLNADIYLPEKQLTSQTKRPVGMIIYAYTLLNTH